MPACFVTCTAIKMTTNVQGRTASSSAETAFHHPQPHFLSLATSLSLALALPRSHPASRLLIGLGCQLPLQYVHDALTSAVVQQRTAKL